MGAGKTRLSTLVAAALDFPAMDMDSMVEEASGQSVREIFERHGEAHFRDLEHRALADTESFAQVVVATGGGTFMAHRNRDLIRRLGRSVFVDVEFDTILDRMSERGRQARPLLQDEERARALFAERQPIYREADMTVEIQRGEAAQAAAEKILEKILATTAKRP